MIKIEKANESDNVVLALLGRITYVESHAHFIEDKNDLKQFIDKAYSVSKMKNEINNPNHIFYLVYMNDLPVGYAKIILNATQENVDSQYTCLLEKIYVLSEFIPLKLGQQLLDFVQKKAKELQLEKIWLTVYYKNARAIRFYERNEFKKVGEFDFPVNAKPYRNIVFSKNI